MHDKMGLAERIHNGDRQAVAEFCRQFQGLIYKRAVRSFRVPELTCLKSDEDVKAEAEDFAQEILIDLIESIQRQVPNIKLISYVNTRIRWRLINYYNRLKARSERETRYNDPEPDDAEGDIKSEINSIYVAIASISLQNNPSIAIEIRELQDIVWEAIRELGPRCQKALQLFHFSHESHAEIAKELNIKNVKSVSAILAKCRAKLRDALSKKFSELNYSPF